MNATPFNLRSLPIEGRLALTCLMLVTLGGYLASGFHMKEQHQNRDGRPGLTMSDIQGVYHGVTTPARMGELLEAGHPREVEGAEPLDEPDVQALRDWLAGEKIAENWSNIDFGDGSGSPEEIAGATCGKCHGPQVPAEERATPLLSTWDHYSELCFDNTVAPTDEAILLMSTHTHALALGTITLLICALMYGTRFPSKMKGILALLASAGLLVDLAAWWLARDSAGFVPLIMAGGMAHAGGMVMMMLAVIADLWAPARPQ